MQGDVISIRDSSGTALVSYTYDAWGNASTACNTDVAWIPYLLAEWNPLRYRGYVYDIETNLYYLQSRYYNPTWGRFISADSLDVLTATPMGLTDKNLFAYCDNNPVMREDCDGAFWDIVFDIVSLVVSVVEVIQNPDDSAAWLGLAGDVIDLIPGVTGVGEATRSLKIANNVGEAIDTADDIADAGKVVSKSTKSARSSAVRQAWKNEVDLVKSTGSGTRSWTTTEIDELLTTGKVKGYVGHHMKSVKRYPDLAGDPLNIQFLTRQDHLRAHGGNWRNVTHGRYIP